MTRNTPDPGRDLTVTASPAPSNPRSSVHSFYRYGFIVVFLLALLTRGGWGVYRATSVEDATRLEFPDERQYWRMAESLRDGNGLVDEFGFRATRMPLYPALLAPFTDAEYGALLAKIWQWIVGALAAVLAGALAFRLIGNSAAWFAGLLVAFDPFLIFFSSLLLTETLTLTAWLALWLVLAPHLDSKNSSLDWPRWILIGVIAAFCVYTREASLGLVVLALLMLVAIRNDRLCTVLGALGAFAIVTIALLPWALRNSNEIGDLTWLTTRGGVSLYDGVRPGATGASDLVGIQDTREVRALGEVEWNRHFRDAAWSAVQDDPARIAQLALIKLARTWNPVPNVETYQNASIRVISALWIIPLFTFALVGAIIRLVQGGGWRTVLFLLVPALYISVLHSLFVGSVRYRLPAMPMLAVLAAVGIVGLGRRVRRSSS